MSLNADLPFVIRLLDDETPAVRTAVTSLLKPYDGDLSEALAESSVDLAPSERRILATLLHPARRERLKQEWIVPSGGGDAIGDDWEQLEGLLRLLSDFLHDGLTVRLPISDALDLLADEINDDIAAVNSDEVRRWLFESGRFVGNEHDYESPHNTDIAWVLSHGKSNAIGLSVVFLLVGRRLGLEVDGINFPGHFLTRIWKNGRPYLVDCYHAGRLVPADELLAAGDLSGAARRALMHPAQPGAILTRMLRNLERAYLSREEAEDAALVRELISSLEPA